MKIEKEVLMNLDELAKEYHLLKDNEGRYYKIKNGQRIEPHGTMRDLGKLLGISETGVKIRIKKNKLKVKRGRAARGKSASYYNLNDVIKVCADLIKELPRADKDGIIIYKGKKYATLRTISKLLNISVESIRRRVKKHKPKSLIAKNQVGGLSEFYEIKIINRICADLANDLPKSDENGIIIYQRKKYATVKALAELFNISVGAIKPRLENNKVPILKGKDLAGRKCDFYSVEESRKACADLDLLITDEEGWAIKDGQVYAPLEVIAKKLKLSLGDVKERIKDLTSKKGKFKDESVKKIYNLIEVKEVCADLLDPDLLIADKNGWAVKDGQRYAPLGIIAKELNLSNTALRKRIKDLDTFPGKNRRGNKIGFYNFEEVKVVCADLLNPDLLIANEEGWAIKDGQLYAPMATIAKKLELSLGAVKRRIKKLTSLKGKCRDGSVKDFYNFEEVKEACADLLDPELLIANEEGWAITKDGQLYAPMRIIAQELKIGLSTIIIRVEKLTSIKGKCRDGSVKDFYNFEEVKKVCADLLDPDLLIADKEGWAVKDGQRYAPIRIIAKELNLTEPMLRSRIKNSNSVKGKDRNSSVRDFYNFEEAKKVCADLLIKKKKRKNNKPVSK